jgi:NADH-quinone oxidoreductase subunit J
VTTKPRLNTDASLSRGLAAVALFAVMAAAFLRAGAAFGAPAGFPADASITESIGYAMFNLDMGAVPGEGFLVAFILIAVVLDAALDGAVLLAKRDDEGAVTDGGRRPGGAGDADDGGEP